MDRYNFRLMMVNPKDNTCDLIDRRNVTLDDIARIKRTYGIVLPSLETKPVDGSWCMSVTEIKIKSLNKSLLATVIINKVVDQQQEKEEKC